jgi:lipopolysaccharide/colanic/teichoic acid biosynthesis glycosyltransferase
MKHFLLRKLLFVLSDIIVLNFAIAAVAAIKLFVLQFESGSLSDLFTVILYSNIYLSIPIMIVFLPFGFYDRVPRVSFVQVLLAVTTGIIILKLVDIIATVATGDVAEIVPSLIGLKLTILYWLFLVIGLFTVRSFLDFLNRSVRHEEESTISGVGALDKSYGISTNLSLVNHSTGYLFLKRIMDIIGSSIALLLFMPSIVVISIAIKLADRKGPVFFRQYRLGKNGQVFRIFKFRTMVMNAEQILRGDRALYEEYIRNNFKLPAEKDPRITWIGAFLRKTSLDELPQLLNAFAGDMSLVGPRPIVVDEIVKYDKYTKKFLSVKPGITGWWQVAGRSNVEYPDRIYLEMFYVERASFFFDLKILFETVPTVLFGRGAH